MVAIIGGLLVARFVTIASQQDGAEELLRDAEGRLATARRREQAANKALQTWDIDDFFKAKVVRAIGDGERDISALREVGGYTSLTDEELTATVQTIEDEFMVARRTVQELLPDPSEDDDYPEWNDFKRAHASLPPTAWDSVWETAYEDHVRPPRPMARSRSPWGIGGLPMSGLAISTPPEYIALDIQRRDALRTAIDRAAQQVEDTEAEHARLQRARDAIVRPKGLGGGLIVLGFFTLVGVIIPIWLLSRGPERLTADLGEVVFWLFLAGLLALLGYMSTLAVRLSGWRKHRATPSGRPL
jgi:hypothetical protein